MDFMNSMPHLSSKGGRTKFFYVIIEAQATLFQSGFEPALSAIRFEFEISWTRAFGSRGVSFQIMFHPWERPYWITCMYPLIQCLWIDVGRFNLRFFLFLRARHANIPNYH